MQQIFKFIEKYKYFLLFLILESFALFFTIQNHSYHRSKFINSANNITGGIYRQMSSINDFFYLKKENRLLSKENIHLKNLLSLSPYDLDSVVSEQIDTVNFYQKYKYYRGKIISNNYTKRNNFLTINRGEKHGITSIMGVVNSYGIIGVTNSVSKHNATVMSILHKDSHTNVKLKNNDHYGSLIWNGKDYRTVQLVDLPRQTQVVIGDTIITGGKSSIFPEGILVGTIKDFEKQGNDFQLINIELFNDMSALSNINIISNLEQEEIKQLETANE
jgi:rod shape-determining protein MreC